MCNQIRCCTARTLKESQQKVLIWNKERPAFRSNFIFALQAMKIEYFVYDAVRHISFLYIPFEGLPVYPDDVYASICLHVEWILVQAGGKYPNIPNIHHIHQI